MSRRRILTMIALLLVAVCAGCGSEESSTAQEESESTPVTPQTTPTSGPDWGSYPADASLDEREVVEAYVDAIGNRDGTTFCGLVAPWISGRFDMYGTDPEASLARPLRCPQLVPGLTDFPWENQERDFVDASVAEFGDVERSGDLVSVPITVTLLVEESGRGEYEEPLEDVVWLTRDAGAWRVAKLGLVASAASIQLESEGDLTAAPDLAAVRRAYAAEFAKAERQRREREASYREVQRTASCRRGVDYPDAGRDVVDYRHPAPPTPTPQLPAADIRAVRVESRDGRICVLFELGGTIRGGTTFDFAIESHDYDWGRSGFTQGFEVELRSDGRARVTSGRDDERRSISVPATVGLDGNRLRLVVDRASFAAGRPFPGSRDPSIPFERFQLRADVTVELSEERHLHDDLGPGPPEGVLRFPYP